MDSLNDDVTYRMPGAAVDLKDRIHSEKTKYTFQTSHSKFPPTNTSPDHLYT